MTRARQERQAMSKTVSTDERQELLALLPRILQEMRHEHDTGDGHFTSREVELCEKILPTLLAARPAAGEWQKPEHRRGMSSMLAERVAWKILCALHENVPEGQRPQSWSDVSGDQEPRIFSAANAAIQEVAATYVAMQNDLAAAQAPPGTAPAPPEQGEGTEEEDMVPLRIYRAVLQRATAAEAERDELLRKLKTCENTAKINLAVAKRATAVETRVRELEQALRLFVDHTTYPVATEINPRGYAWRSEEALDYAYENARATLHAAEEVDYYATAPAPPMRRCTACGDMKLEGSAPPEQGEGRLQHLLAVTEREAMTFRDRMHKELERATGAEARVRELEEALRLARTVLLDLERGIAPSRVEFARIDATLAKGCPMRSHK